MHQETTNGVPSLSSRYPYRRGATTVLTYTARIRTRDHIRLAGMVLLIAVLLGLTHPRGAHSDTWSYTGSMTTPRRAHTATLLPNGKVLVAGGSDDVDNILSSAEVYDPSTGSWTPTGSMRDAHRVHSAILLPNGKVLVAGGIDDVLNALASAEVYDPSTGSWTPTGSLNTPRWGYGMTLLSNGKVLAVGGWPHITDYGVADAEVYDPSTGI